MVKYLRFVGRVSDWILFGILLFFALLFAFLSIYAFSALLSMALFMLPVGWFKSEFKLRFTLFLLTVAFLILLFAVSGVPPVYIGVEVALAGFSTPLLVKRFRWIVSEFIGARDVLYLATFSMVVAVLAFFSRQLEHLIAISGFLATILMLNYLCTALRRSELSRILLEIGEFKAPEEFIEKVIEKAGVKDAERRDFIRYRFREFLDCVERGVFGQAYVTLATGILEQIIIEQPDIGKSSIWDIIKDNELKKWYTHYGRGCGKGEAASHNDIRAAIVHSTPPKSTNEREKREDRYSEEGMRMDLRKKKAILSKFRIDPITPIECLLKATAGILKIGKSKTKPESKNQKTTAKAPQHNFIRRSACRVFKDFFLSVSSM
jgi:hypothetical protein